MKESQKGSKDQSSTGKQATTSSTRKSGKTTKVEIVDDNQPSQERILISKSSGLLIAGLTQGFNGLDVKLKPSDESVDKVVAPLTPDIELLNASLAKRELTRNLEMVQLPLEATEKYEESVLARLLDGSDLSADAQNALASMVSSAATQYFLSVEERRAYLDIAIEALKETHTMAPDQWKKLQSELDLILTDGFKKSFRDGFGRSLPIPEATLLARSVEASSASLKDALASKSVISEVGPILAGLQRYLRLEQRARYAVTEVEKDMIVKEAVSLTDSMTDYPVIGALVLNRFLYTSRSNSVMIKVPRFAVAPSLGGTPFSLNVKKIKGPVKFVEFTPHAILSSDAESVLQFVSAKEVLIFISELVGYRHVPKESDLIAEVFGMALDIDRIKKALKLKDEDARLNLTSGQALSELFNSLFKERLIDMVIDSFVTAPSFSSQTLNSIRTSAYDEETIKRIEPYIIAVDNLKTAYFAAIKDVIAILRPRLLADIPERFVAVMKEQLENEHSFSFSITTDQPEWFGNLLNFFEGMVSHPSPVTIAHILPNLSDSTNSWSAITHVTRDGEKVKVVRDDLIASAAVETHSGRIQSNLMIDVPDDIIMVLQTATSGRFTSRPYARYDVKFDSALLTDLFSYMTLPVFKRLSEEMAKNGMEFKSKPEPILINPKEDPKDLLVANLLKLAVTKEHWVIKVPPELFITPKFQNNLIIQAGGGNTDEVIQLDSPWITIKPFDKSVESFDMATLPFKGQLASKVLLAPEIWPSVRYSYSLLSKMRVRAPKSIIDSMAGRMDERFEKFKEEFRNTLTDAVMRIPELVRDATSKTNDEE